MSSAENAAIDFLGAEQVLAWDSTSRQRTFGLLELFARGKIDKAGMRAALGSDRQLAAVPRTNGVSVLTLTGVLTPGDSIFTLFGAGTSLRAFMHQLESATRDASIKAIAVVVDSPGGMVGMATEASAAMRAARAVKPVTVAVAGLNASAAYWVTSGASSITATPSAIVGSIGVYTMRPTVTRQLDAAGIDVEVFSAGRYKVEGLDVLPVTEAERQATQARVDESYAQFVADIAAGRGVSSSSVRSGYGEGRAVSAATALRLGMIDGLDSIDRAVSRAASLTPMRASAEDRRLRERFDMVPDEYAEHEDDDRRRRLERY